MRKNLNNGTYKTKRAFVDDMNRIFTNCLHYHYSATLTPISKMLRYFSYRLLDEFQKKYLPYRRLLGASMYVDDLAKCRVLFDKVCDMEYVCVFFCVYLFIYITTHSTTQQVREPIRSVNCCSSCSIRWILQSNHDDFYGRTDETVSKEGENVNMSLRRLNKIEYVRSVNNFNHIAHLVVSEEQLTCYSFAQYQHSNTNTGTLSSLPMNLRMQ